MNSGKKQRLLYPFLGVALIMAEGIVPGATVYFNDASRESTTTLQVDGVTITGSQLVTVPGLGLGLNNGIGPAGEFDREMHFPAGQIPPDNDLQPGVLQLSVNGILNSVTIVPHFRIFDAAGNLTGDILTFGIIDYFPGETFGDIPEDVINASSIEQPLSLYPTPPITPGSPNTVQFQIASDFGEFNDFFVGYRTDHQSQEQTFQFGFSVLSLDYTPIPEPGMISLLALGFAGFFWVNRRMQASL